MKPERGQGISLPMKEVIVVCGIIDQLVEWDYAKREPGIGAILTMPGLASFDQYIAEGVHPSRGCILSILDGLEVREEIRQDVATLVEKYLAKEI